MSARPTGATARPRRIFDYLRRYAGFFALGAVCLVLTQGFALSVPRLLRRATDALVLGQVDEVTGLAWALMGVAVAGALVRIASRLLIFETGRRVEFELRNDLFDKFASLGPDFFAKHSTGKLMSTAVNDLTQVRLVLGPGLLNLTNTSLVYLVVVPLLLLSDLELAFYSLLPLPILVAIGLGFGTRLYVHSRKIQDYLADLSTRVQENLGGVMTVRVYRREDGEREIFEAKNRVLVAENEIVARLRGLMFPTMGLLGAFGVVALLLVGGQKMLRDEMSVGQFVEFNAYLSLLVWPTLAFGWMLALFQRGRASMDRINEILLTEPSLVDGPLALPSPSGRLDVSGLTVSFPASEGSAPAARPALDDLTASFRPGQLVVVVGRTGAGKSTLLRALVRLLPVPPGTVHLDDRDVTELRLADARAAIGYAPQEAFLFSRTIRDNIAFGRADASMDEITTAARRAGVHKDILGLKEGYDTMVGERGITLSGGQRQRVALARALLLDPKILVLDDTLSAVDNETEAEILGALAEVARARTTIIVTHRLALAKDADLILVLEDGRIVERGVEAELLAKRGVYARMYEKQRLRLELLRLESQAS